VTLITNYLKGVLLFIALLIIGGVMMIIALPLWGNTILNRWFLQSFSFAARKIVGLKFVVLNEEKINTRRPAVLIGNHQTGLDLAIIGALCPARSVIVAKKELQYIPLFGWFFKAAGNLLINRSKAEDAKSMINRVTTELNEKNLNLVIFPEGTRNRHKDGSELMLPFKKGAFHIAARTGLPVIPVVCSTLKGKSIWENFDLKGGIIVMSVMDPVETQGLSTAEVDLLRDQIREQMIVELRRVNILADQYEANAKDSKKCAPGCCS
jgi:lysophosphatidate acyltransferase